MSQKWRRRFRRQNIRARSASVTKPLPLSAKHASQFGSNRKPTIPCPPKYAYEGRNNHHGKDVFFEYRKRRMPGGGVDDRTGRIFDRRIAGARRRARVYRA
jgi:hypothetical protein